MNKILKTFLAATLVACSSSIAQIDPPEFDQISDYDFEVSLSFKMECIANGEVEEFPRANEIRSSAERFVVRANDFLEQGEFLYIVGFFDQGNFPSEFRLVTADMSGNILREFLDAQAAPVGDLFDVGPLGGLDSNVPIVAEFRARPSTVSAALFFTPTFVLPLGILEGEDYVLFLTASMQFTYGERLGDDANMRLTTSALYGYGFLDEPGSEDFLVRKGEIDGFGVINGGFFFREDPERINNGDLNNIQ